MKHLSPCFTDSTNDLALWSSSFQPEETDAVAYMMADNDDQDITDTANQEKQSSKMQQQRDGRGVKLKSDWNS